MIPSQVSEHISLRLLEPQHAPALFQLTDENRAYLRRWLPWLDNITRVEDTRDFIAVAQRQRVENDGFQCLIYYRDEPVGMIGHHGIDWPHATTSLGYWLIESMQGRGIVTRACRAHVDYAFHVLDLDCVKIRCAVENTRSRAIPERLGFRHESTLPKAEWLYDRFVDHAVYSMLAANWQ